MNVAVGQIWSVVADALNLHSDDDMNKIKQGCQLAYQDICGMLSWKALRRKATIDFADADVNNSMLLPADLAGIDSIWSNDADHSHQYYPVGWGGSETEAHGGLHTHRWFYTEPQEDALAILQNVTMNEGAFTFETSDWNDVYIGEYFQVGAEPGVYKLTAAQTFTPRWYGPKLSGTPDDNIQIRPAGTQRFSIIGRHGKFEAKTVCVYYWAYPPPLYKEFQPIMLPSSRPLELATLIRLVGQMDLKNKVANIYRAEYPVELDKMIAMNPRFIAPVPTVDRSGRTMAFTSRGRGYPWHT